MPSNKMVPIPTDEGYAAKARNAVKDVMDHNYTMAAEIDLTGVERVDILQVTLNRLARHNSHGKMTGRTQRNGNKLIFWMVPFSEEPPTSANSNKTKRK